MRAKVILSSAALSQLTMIGDYIAGDSPTAAVKMIEAIESKCESLSLLPNRGAQFRDQYRQVFIGPFQIIYRVDDTDPQPTVVIITIHHTAQERV